MYGNDMKTHYTYNWSKREGLEEGSTVQKLIDQGIERPKLSNDVIGALFKVLGITHSLFLWLCRTMLQCLKYAYDGLLAFIYGYLTWDIKYCRPIPSVCEM